MRAFGILVGLIAAILVWAGISGLWRTSEMSASLAMLSPTDGQAVDAGDWAFRGRISATLMLTLGAVALVGGSYADGQRLDVCLDGAIAGGELGLTGMEECEILLQDEEMLGPVVFSQGCDDLGLGGTFAAVHHGRTRALVLLPMIDGSIRGKL